MKKEAHMALREYHEGSPRCPVTGLSVRREPHWAKAGPGGGYVLSDSHGEIPFQVPEQVLTAISEAVHRWGRYPLSQGLK